MSISVEVDKNGNVVAVDNVRSVHSKDATKELSRLSKLGEEELKKALRWVERKEVLEWLFGSGLYRHIPKDTSPELLSVAKVLNDFVNPTIPSVKKTEKLRALSGVVYGWAEGNRIHLTPEGINAETPIHEYTHLWAKAVQAKAPKLWANTKDLLRGTPMWDEVQNDAGYQDIRDNEDAVASEVLSRLSGKRNAEKFEQAAQEMLYEAKGTFEKAVTRRQHLPLLHKSFVMVR